MTVYAPPPISFGPPGGGGPPLSPLIWMVPIAVPSGFTKSRSHCRTAVRGVSTRAPRGRGLGEPTVLARTVSYAVRLTGLPLTETISAIEKPISKAPHRRRAEHVTVL